jgi:hypothetical protein
MNRQQKRRIEREWNKIKVGGICSGFLERNSLFSPPYVLVLQAVKASDELICVYSISLFESKKDSGFEECITTCMFICSSLRSLGSIAIGLVSEVSFWVTEEIEG